MVVEFDTPQDTYRQLKTECEAQRALQEKGDPAYDPFLHTTRLLQFVRPWAEINFDSASPKELRPLLERTARVTAVMDTALRVRDANAVLAQQLSVIAAPDNKAAAEMVRLSRANGRNTLVKTFNALKAEIDALAEQSQALNIAPPLNAPNAITNLREIFKKAQAAHKDSVARTKED